MLHHLHLAVGQDVEVTASTRRFYLLPFHIMFIDPTTLGEILYVLQEDDAQGTLQEIAPGSSPLTDEELHQVKKGIEYGLGDVWSEVMKTAVRLVLDERQ